MESAYEEFRDADLRLLAERGIAPDEARRQLELLRRPPAPLRLVRPCAIGDGILALAGDERERLAALHDEAALAGRLTKFVPASGAASRMFRDLVALRAAGCPATAEEAAARARAGDAAAGVLHAFLAGLDRFAFAPELRRAVEARGRSLDRLVAEGPVIELLVALVDPSGLGYAGRAKGLLPFHRYGKATRTALEEHLREAAELVRDREGNCRIHFTVSSAERPAFEEAAAEACSRIAREGGATLRVGFSEQKPSTDTLAIDLRGAPFRDAGGALVLRPGGHGALLENLAELGADLVHVKNVDNVAAEPLLRRGVPWKQALVGLVVRLEREARERLAALAARAPGGEEAARRFLRESFGADADDAAEAARLLRRPLRACAVVRNAGEPGGGPFWVRAADGRLGRQIVEGAQVDGGSEEQQGIFAASTHFNPVDLVLALRDPRGEPHDLRRHVDPGAVFLARKSWHGRELVALERPGLWNGAMADWNTVFVEVPRETFTPVKTVLDLLRPEHQPGDAAP